MIRIYLSGLQPAYDCKRELIRRHDPSFVIDAFLETMTTTTQSSVLIADDHDLIRRGLRAIVESHSGWSVCAEASTGRAAVQLAKLFSPAIAILDIGMPELNGIEAARRIRKACQRTEVLIFSAHYSHQLMQDAIKAGARGYVLKSDADRHLLSAMDALLRHENFAPPAAPEVTRLPADEKIPVRNPGDASNRELLTSREREIIQLLSEGKTTKDMALTLRLSAKTVDTHRANILRKLKLHNIADVVRYAVRNLIVEP